MAFQKANILTTREIAFGSRRLGQIVAVPSGRLDKVSVYIEPIVADIVGAQSVNVILEVYDLGMDGYPTGAPLASDYATLSDIAIRGFYNFRIEAYVPTVVALVLRVPNGDGDNHVSWRYVNASSGGEELLSSSDDGGTWTANPTRKFAYRTFSLKPSAIDIDNQTATISAGTLQTVSDATGAQFSLGELDKTAVTGDTVAISFGDFVITLVLDQSGSMTWNDRDGLRFDFLKDFASDIDASLPVSSTATYSLIKFRGRRVGKMTIGVSGSESTGLHLDGIRIVRKAGSVPTSITDGCIVSEGLAEQFEDLGAPPCPALSTGIQYYYSAFAFANLGGSTLYSSGLSDYGFLTTPVKAPLGVAGLSAEVIITDNVGVALIAGATDFGYRKVSLTWLNAAGFNYTTITLVRRDDRPPTSPLDGDILFSGAPAATTSYIDSFGGTYAFPNGLTYYYAIFTTNAIGIKCGLPNAAQAKAEIASAPRPWEQLEPPANVPPIGFDITPPGPPVVTVVESNGEIQLSWVPADSDTKRYKLFYDPKKAPAPTNEIGSSYSGEVIYDGTGTSFIHRSLLNGQPHFYALIAIDAVENVSTPVRPLVAGRPPKPSEDATVFLPPDPVSAFEAEIVNAGDIRLSWNNPKAEVDTTSFYFGDSIKIVASVEFIDPGVSENFLTFEFVENDNSRTVTPYDQANTVDPNVFLNFAHVQSVAANTIIGVVSVVPVTDIQNLISTAKITLRAALRVKSRATGAILSEITTKDITINFNNPFDLAIKNEPAQNVQRRVWKINSDPEEPCQQYEYENQQFAGVYVNSGKGFDALIESSFRGLPLEGPLNVTLSLLDKKTLLPSTLLTLPQTTAQTTSVFETSNVTDEVLDRSGEPTGEENTRSLLSISLPPSAVSGDFILRAEAEFEGYSKTVDLEIHYEPILNIDLNLTPFNPDNVDRTEQSAYVYMAPFDAEQSQKVPVDDFTVTEWSIRPLCDDPAIFNLQSEDNVPGLGIKSYTRGGLAQKIFWGPGEIDTEEQFYEIHVKAKVGGQVGEGFGMLRLGEVESSRANKIFLRNANADEDFSTSEIFSDGFATTTWEVIARPEDDEGSGPNDSASGQSFRNAVVALGGNVPSLDDGRVVTLKVQVKNDSDPEQNGLVGGELTSIIESVRIKTNMTGANGKAGSAKAKIVNGKATFTISVNARVPKKKDSISEEELVNNLFYSRYGIQFAFPDSGVSLVLTALTSVEINGRSISFVGGGGSLVASAPPCFVELKEPLEPA